MFCSVTESVNKEVEVQTVGENAQFAQPVHLKAPSSIFPSNLVSPTFALSTLFSHFLHSPSIAQGRTSVACWQQGRSPSPPRLRSSPPFPCICSLAPVIIYISEGEWPHLLEHLWFNPLYLDVLVSWLCHAASEHPVEVVRVGSQDDPVRREGGRLDQDCHVGEVAGLCKPVQIAPSVLLPAPKLHPCFVLVEPSPCSAPAAQLSSDAGRAVSCCCRTPRQPQQHCNTITSVLGSFHSTLLNI